MSYIYKVFENLEQLWMGIWQPTHTVTTTEVSPDLGELAEILDNVSVEMIPLRRPLRYRWGCRTFQIASYIYVNICEVFSIELYSEVYPYSQK
jgi:hypothetical protein